MDNPTTTEPQPSSPSQELPPSMPVAPIKARRGFPILAVFGLGAAALVCVCGVVAMVTLGGGALKVFTDRPKVEAVIGEFMLAMNEGDTDRALALFSARARRQMSVSDLETMLEGKNIYLFEGYESVTISSFNLTAAATTNADAPQGTVAKVTGTIEYAGGFQGVVEATLEQDGGEWGLFFININIPPDKIP